MPAMIARTGILLAVLQLAFALTWVVYVAYLPALAAQAGLPRTAVPWILLVDQVIFVVCDWLAGVFADRVGDAVSRLGRQIALVTAVSCAAFLALPFVAPTGSAALVIALVVLWSATSSILRAPSLTLASRHAARPQRAWLASSYTFGLGAAGAVAPYLVDTLATTDPRIPFAATSVIVAALTVVLAAMPHGPATPPAPAPAPPPPRPSLPLAGFAVALVLLAIGLQVHASITSSAIYLRFVARDDLVDVLPVFWIGFNIASLPLALILQRVSSLAVMTAAGVIGTAALLVVQAGDSLAAVIVAQLFAGLAWSGVLVGAFATTTALDHKAGRTTGLVFSLLAAATAARITFVATGLAATPDIAGFLPWIPPVGWAVAALVLASFAVRSSGSSAPP
jgi:hypothetical protein